MAYFKRQFAELFRMNWAGINLSKPTLGMIVVLIALILLSTIGSFGFTMAFGSSFAMGIDLGSSRRQRAAVLNIFALSGAVVALLGNVAEYSEWSSVVVIFGVTLVCCVAPAFGPRTVRDSLCAPIGFLPSSLFTVMNLRSSKHSDVKEILKND